MITVREVKTKKEQKEFLNFPLKMYKNNPYFVPPLYADEARIFRSDYVYYDQAEAVYFNAYIDNIIVGRISGIIQKASNEKQNEKRVRFTRFDAINNQEVADSLFNTLENWGREKGMDTICEPLGFSDLEREGLLIEGFDELATFEEQYNFYYYQELIENCGYQKEVDWLERKIIGLGDRPGRLSHVSEMMMKKYNLSFAKAKNVKDFLEHYGDQIFNILDETYKNLYGTVPFTPAMKKMTLSNFKLLIDMKHLSAIVDENDQVVCFGICLPSIAKAVQKSQGHLTLPTLYRILRSIKKPKIVDLALIGVLPKYQMLGISTALLAYIEGMISDPNVEYLETNLNLEDNNAIQNQWKNFENIQHKRRRSYCKKLSSDESNQDNIMKNE